MAYDRLIGFFISPETNLDLLVFEEENSIMICRSTIVSQRSQD